jgi:hypothetical protein
MLRHLTVLANFAVSFARIPGRAPKPGEYTEEIGKQLGLS